VGSVLFTDLVGFTEYNDAVGDVEALRLLDTQTELANAMVAEWQGARIVKELGDGLMIWFRGAAEGLAGAVSLLETVRRARQAGEFALAIRMGLHHGEVIPRGQDLVGQTINIAARVSDLAGPGELLVSDSVVKACSLTTVKELTPIGAVRVKGVHDPLWLHRLNLSD
jgi:adenylate cyclase